VASDLRKLTFTTDKTHFAGAIAQNELATEDIPNGNASWKDCVCDIIGLTLIAKQNLKYRVVFFSKGNIDVQIDAWAWSYEFYPSDGIQIRNTEPFGYGIVNFKGPYEDLDNTGKFHIGIMPLSEAKNAGADGGIVLKWVVEGNIPSPLSKPPDFDKLTNDPQLASILRNRWEEAQVCSRAGAHLSAIVMMGSVLEGTLLAVVECNPEKSNKAKAAPRDQIGRPLSFGDWDLNALIDVAHECGWLQVDVKRFSHSLRESRNIVHVRQQLALNEYPDKDTCNICWEVVQAAVNDLERGIIQP